ncbi:MAG TPA: ricin-type beta-trefoil lectin domain protein, partial [Nakamurella sp.]
GAHAIVWDCDGGANQRWYWNGEEIRSRLNTKCLDVENDNPRSGAHAIVWDCDGGANQRWY